MTTTTVTGLALFAIFASGLGRGTEPVGHESVQDPIAGQFAELANVVRADAGCAPLKWHDGAAAVARSHSADMKANGYFSHSNREGKSPFDRLADAGITYRTAAENILEGEASPTRVLQLWMQSPGHRMNIVECSFTHHGIGRVDTHWTHIFLRDPGSFDSSESTLSVGQADVDIGEAG